MKFLARGSRSTGGLQRIFSRSPGLIIISIIIMTSFVYMFSSSAFSNPGETLGTFSEEGDGIKVTTPSDSDISEVSEGLNIDLEREGLEQTDTPFMPKMGNATLRKELGNASWKLFHTILARYPDEPTDAQKSHLRTYIYTFAQVYPCGDCARHFIKLLKKFPPQLNSRKNAAVWGCDVHNQVNEKLHHPIYDCSNILEDYDCGCGVDEESEDYTLQGKTLKEVQGDAVDKSESQKHLDSIHVESKEAHVGG